MIDDILSSMKECKNSLSHTSQEEKKPLKISIIIHLSHQCHLLSTIIVFFIFTQIMFSYMFLYLLISVEKQLIKRLIYRL